MESPISVYIHVPFCIKRHEASDPTVCEAGAETRSRYLDALEREIDAAQDLISGRELASIYVGGGGSMLRSDRFARLLLKLVRSMHPVHAMEFTIRFPPQTLLSTTISGFNVCSFNRVSVEALCSRGKDFDQIGNPHSYNDVEDGLNMLSIFKCPNCDVELLYGIPNQSEKAFENQLCTYTNFRSVTHITLMPYHGEGCVDDAVLAQRFDQAVDYLGKRGFSLYGAGRFSKPRKECRFFYQECIGVERLGFGAGARSTIDGYSYTNTSDIVNYIDNSANYEKIIENPIKLDATTDFYRRLALRLQLAEPFALDELGGEAAVSGMQAAERLIARGLAVVDGNNIAATRLALRSPEQVRKVLLG